MSGVDFVQWLRDQLDEDERIAHELKDLIPRLAWIADRALRLERELEWNVPTTDRTRILKALPPEPEGLTWVEAEVMRGTAHDPARVLREIDAKRKLLDDYEITARIRDESAARIKAAGDHPDSKDLETWDRAEREVAILEGPVRLLALPYSDRPGYKAEEWAP